MADVNKIGEAFVGHYYSIFDSNRSNLQGLYREQSLLSFEGQGFQGVSSIINKLTTLPFQQCSHQIKTLDVHPTCYNSILIMVTGDIKIDNDPNPVKFSQMFHLVPTNNTNTDFWVMSDVFRLNYG